MFLYLPYEYSNEHIVDCFGRTAYLYRIHYSEPVVDGHHHWNSFGLQTLKLSVLALCPFGMQVRSCPGGEGCLSVLMNILWILVGGIWISLSHLAFGLLLCITIIGIPFGLQHFKLAGLALTPFGKEIV